MRVRHYLDSCRMSHVGQQKKNSFSFFLTSISRYLKRRPAGRNMILHLRKRDKNRYNTAYRRLLIGRKSSIEALIDQTDTDTFDLFQALMFALLVDPDNDDIHHFTEGRPVTYDPASDSFFLNPESSREVS